MLLLIMTYFIRTTALASIPSRYVEVAPNEALSDLWTDAIEAGRAQLIRTNGHEEVVICG